MIFLTIDELLYCTGATTINPILLTPPFERLINPITFNAQLLPTFKVCRDKFVPTAERADIPLDEAIFTRAQHAGLIEDRLAKIATNTPLTAISVRESGTFRQQRHYTWQEQIIELLRRMGDFSYAEADRLRRDGGKGLWRNAVWYENVRNIFLPHAVACGYSYHFEEKYLRYIQANIYIRALKPMSPQRYCLNTYIVTKNPPVFAGGFLVYDKMVRIILNTT